MNTYLNGIPVGCKWRADAIRPAQDTADSTSLPQTQFYHPDWGWTAVSASTPLHDKLRRDRKTEVWVTWLPSNYFVGWGRQLEVDARGLDSDDRGELATCLRGGDPP